MEARRSAVRTVVVGAALLLSLGLWGCPSDGLVSAVPVQWKMLIVQSSSGRSQLALYSFPKGTVENPDVYASANGVPLDGSVTAIAQFRSMLFLVQPDRQRIVVLDAATFRSVAQVPTAPHTPVGICFANATTGYIAYSDSTVGILDVTVFQVVGTITVGHTPRGIAAMGNRVAVCNQADGTVSIIDTRTNAVVAVVPVAPYPTFVGGGSDPATSFAIVSLGNGKLSTEPPSAAMLTFYDPFAGSVGAQIELAQLYRDALATVPRGLITTPAATAFVLLDGEVQMADIAGQRLLGTILPSAPVGGAYDFARNLVLLWTTDESGTTVIALDPASGQEKGRATVPVTFQVAAGL
ncbi:MAG: hypothetical protein KatS3mg038_2689 [Candidatus Kapaibacterium sp.]|nr:MAG: hypothetical protein KatS3mg038_2689 [Candidatus Kapabacteria bacterium]